MYLNLLKIRILSCGLLKILVLIDHYFYFFPEKLQKFLISNNL